MSVKRRVSQLYHLVPVGVGTPFVESLESYIKRLAEAHCVSVGSLLSKVILPSLNCGYIRVTHLTGSKARRINNIGSRSEAGLTHEIVSCLEELTGHKELANISLLPLQNHISGNKLLKKTSSWCPYCYQDAVDTGSPICDQLIWTIFGIDICLRHQVQLRDSCPICYSHQHFLDYSSRNGICQNCGAWLGASKEQSNDNICDDSNRAKWNAKSVGEMIKQFGVLSDTRSHFVLNIANMVDQKKLSIRKLASMFGITHQTLRLWMNESTKPELSLLLHIGRLLCIDPLDLLTKEIQGDFSFNDINVKLTLQKEMSKIDNEKIRKELNYMIKNREFNSIAECSRIMGHSPKYLRERFPEETSKIIEKHRLNQKEARDKKYELIEQTIDKLHAIGVPPSRKAITHRLNRRIVNNEKAHHVWAEKVTSLGYNPLDFH